MIFTYRVVPSVLPLILLVFYQCPVAAFSPNRLHIFRQAYVLLPNQPKANISNYSLNCHTFDNLIIRIVCHTKQRKMLDLLFHLVLANK